VTGIRNRIGAAVLGAALVIFPLVANQYWIVQVGIRALWLGTVGLSLVFLAGYGGMVSLAQTAVYGVAGYGVAATSVKYGLSWPVAIPVGVVVAVAFSAVVGLVSVRAQGVYFLMITLACSVTAYYFALQAPTVTNGHTGFTGVSAPYLKGVFDLSEPRQFYYAALILAALAYLGVRYLATTPFGTALQGVRDNPERMRALGYRIETIRLVAFCIAGLVAALGGVVAVYYNGQISPDSINVTRTVDILVVTVLGGLRRPAGAFVGAVLFALLANFASDYTDRYNTVIGLVFLLVIWFSPTGVLGLFDAIRRRLSRPTFRGSRPAPGAVHS
jgi:branched-chain amino acid transport system permease protein